MLILTLGVALWWAAHLFKRVAPGWRAAMDSGAGSGAKGMIALLLVVSVILMIVGYRMADGTFWWGAPGMLKGITKLLVLVAFYLFPAAGIKPALARRMRHPQLPGVSLWAFAHLLPNGDLASFLLFGGLLLWALVEMVVITKAEPDWRPVSGPVVMRKEVMAGVGAFIVFGVVALIHSLLGYNPFGG